MTRAPENLLAVRQLLLTHLNVDKDTVRAADLEPAEVGIVGDPAHRGGYHCGSDRVVSNDYSVVESSRDRAGLDDNACGLDVGMFRVTTPKGTFDLPHYSRWLVAQCAAGTPDTRDIREVIYSPDGKVVRRWDRLGRRSSGDNSHLSHTHKSYFRDAIKAGRDQTAVVRRYLTTIGLIEGDDTFMAGLTEDEQRELLTGVRYLKNICNVAGYRVEALVSQRPTYNNQMGNKAAPNVLAQRLAALGEAVARESASPDEVRALLNDMPAPATAEAIGDEVIAGLGVRPAAEVVAALQAAGVDLDDLRAELDRLAAGTAQDAPAAPGS